MKKLMVTAIACVITYFSFSQEFKTETSPHFKKESDKDVYQIIFPSAYGFMTLHHLDNVMMDNTKTMVLTKYDQSMQAIDTKTFNLPKLGLRAADLVDTIELEDELIFISTVVHKKMGKHEVNAQVFAQTDHSVSDNKILASFPIDSYSKSGFYQIAVSPDQTKIAIYANMPFEKKTKETVKVWVYDNQLNLLWEQSATLDYDSERAYNEEAFVSNAGMVIVNKVVDAHKKSRKSMLLSFDGNKVATKDFSSPGFVPLHMTLIDVNGQPMLTGFYGDGSKSIIQINSKEGVENSGAFLYNLKAHKLIGIHEWSDPLRKNDLRSLHVVHAEVSDTDIYLIGEKRLTDSEFKKSGNTMTTEMDYLYTFGPSVLVNLDTNGTLKSFNPLFTTITYKNDAKEKGSLSALQLENGLRIFSNQNNHITFSSFFNDNKGTFLSPRIIPFENGTYTIPFVLPQTVRAVKNYGIVYYITNYGDRYWLNKMTW